VGRQRRTMRTLRELSAQQRRACPGARRHRAPGIRAWVHVRDLIPRNLLRPQRANRSETRKGRRDPRNKGRLRRTVPKRIPGLLANPLRFRRDFVRCGLLSAVVPAPRHLPRQRHHHLLGGWKSLRADAPRIAHAFPFVLQPEQPSRSAANQHFCISGGWSQGLNSAWATVRGFHDHDSLVAPLVLVVHRTSWRDYPEGLQICSTLSLSLDCQAPGLNFAITLRCASFSWTSSRVCDETARP